ncbi:MAG: hypothetical protein Q8J76_09090, partial [Desulfobulbaceae bacterium]|nr:hypothetical protein [Desulfobulbaceae bacterium]
MKIRFIVVALICSMVLAAPFHTSANSLNAVEAEVTRALQADNSGDLKKSLAQLKTLDPSSPLLAKGLVRLAGKGDDALIYEALSVLNAAIAKHPGDMTLKRTRALFIIGAPWQRLALADLEEVIAAEDPGATALQAFVDAAAGNDQTDLGEAKISEALNKKQSQDPGLLRARADIRYIKGNFDGALKDLSQAVSLTKASLADHLLRYRIHTKQEKD